MRRWAFWRKSLEARAADLIDRAVVILHKEGWVQEQMVETELDGSVVGYCAVGALRRATGATPDSLGQFRNAKGGVIVDFDDPVYLKALDGLARCVEDGGHDVYYTDEDTVTSWNDDSIQDEQTVIGRMRRCAASIREKQGQ